MGMFDTVWFKCPTCGGAVEQQSKAGDCELQTIPASEVPAEIAASIEGEYISCRACGEHFKIRVARPTLATVSMELT